MLRSSPTAISSFYLLRATVCRPYILGRYFVTAGALMSYGIDNIEVLQKVASYVDRILRGAKPVNLRQAPTKYETALNLETARTLVDNAAHFRRRSDRMNEAMSPNGPTRSDTTFSRNLFCMIFLEIREHEGPRKRGGRWTHRRRR